LPKVLQGEPITPSSTQEATPQGLRQEVLTNRSTEENPKNVEVSMQKVETSLSNHQVLKQKLSLKLF
jgi:hypothetical protein